MENKEPRGLFVGWGGVVEADDGEGEGGGGDGVTERPEGGGEAQFDGARRERLGEIGDWGHGGWGNGFTGGIVVGCLVDLGEGG